VLRNRERSPIDVVLSLIWVVNGELPRLATREVLHSVAEIHMDAIDFCGIEIWYKLSI